MTYSASLNGNDVEANLQINSAVQNKQKIFTSRFTLKIIESVHTNKKPGFFNKQSVKNPDFRTLHGRLHKLVRRLCIKSCVMPLWSVYLNER